MGKNIFILLFESKWNERYKYTHIDKKKIVFTVDDGIRCSLSKLSQKHPQIIYIYKTEMAQIGFVHFLMINLVKEYGPLTFHLFFFSNGFW